MPDTVILLHYDEAGDRITIKTIPDGNNPDRLYDLLYGAMMQIRRLELAALAQAARHDQVRAHRSQDDAQAHAQETPGQEPGAGTRGLANYEQD